MKHHKLSTAIGVLSGALALSACAETTTAPAADDSAAIVKPLAADPDRSSVRLADTAVQRLGIKTAPVRSGAGASTATAREPGAKTVVPYGAIIYDPSGGTWTYTETKPLTYVRVKIVVDRIVGSRALLLKSPPVGTPVVTVGAAELYGAEVGVDH
jgi:hypothetical protein